MTLGPKQMYTKWSDICHLMIEQRLVLLILRHPKPQTMRKLNVQFNDLMMSMNDTDEPTTREQQLNWKINDKLRLNLIGIAIH